MKLKRFACMALVSVLLFDACLTPSSNTGRQPASWVSGTGRLNANLGKNEIAYRDDPAGLPDGVETNLFGRLSWFNSMLELLDLHEALSFDEKETLFNALFGYIPAGPTGDYYRMVSIGGYFENGEALSLYARVLRPSEKAPQGSAGVLEFTGNFMAVRDRQTGLLSRQQVNTISFLNWYTNGIVFSDNVVVRAADLYSQEDEDKIKEEYKDSLYLQYVNLADSYIKDEKTENDGRALEMLNEAYANDQDTTIKIVAKLNTFLYYLLKDDAAGAEEALNTAAQLSRGLADIDPSFRRVIDIEAPVMLQLYKNNR